MISTLAEVHGLDIPDYLIELDMNGSPHLSLAKLLKSQLKRGDADPVLVDFWRRTEQMENTSLFLYDTKQLNNPWFTTDFATRMRKLLSISDIVVEEPVFISLDHGIIGELPNREIFQSYIEEYLHLYEEYSALRQRLGTEGFDRMAAYGVVGQFLSVFGGVLGDRLLDFGNDGMEAILRWIGGNGENIPYAYYYFTRRLDNDLEKKLSDVHDCCVHEDNDSEIFAKWKLVGALLPFAMHGLTKMIGISITASGLGVIPAFFYPLSDTIVSQAALWFSNVRRANVDYEMPEALKIGTKNYLSKPATWFGLSTIMIAYGGGFLGRAFLYSDTTYAISATESAAANLCVVTPLGTALYDYFIMQRPLHNLTDEYARRLRA